MIKLFLLVFTLPSFAGVYNYYPESTMSLGRGFNPFKPTQQYQECFEHDGEEEIDTEGAVSTDVIINLVKSYKDLYQYLRFSASAAASFKVYSGSASIEFEEESMFHSDSLTWLILFRSDFGRKGIRAPRLKDEYQELSAKELYQKCGSEVATSVRRGSMVYALLTVKNLKQDYKSRLEKQFKAKASGSLWSAKMKGHYKEIINSALMSHEVSVKIHAVGGEGLKKFKDLLGKEYVDYQKLPSVLSNYLQHLNKENSAPLQYTTTPLSVFAKEPVEHQVFSAGPLSELYYQYQSIYSKANRLYKILYGSDQNKYEINNREHLSGIYKSLMEIQNRLWNAAQTCLSPKKECKVPFYEIQLIQWPHLLKNYCENQRLTALDQGVLSLEFYVMAKKRNLIPIIEHQKVVGYKTCH